MSLADDAKSINVTSIRGCKFQRIIDDIGAEEVHEAFNDPDVSPIKLLTALHDRGYTHLARHDVQHHITNVCKSCRTRFAEAGI